MTNDLKKGFLTGSGELLDVLSIPVGVYILYLLYTPVIMSLQKKEYLEYEVCYQPASLESIVKAEIKPEDDYLKASKDFTEKYILQVCGKLPKR